MDVQMPIWPVKSYDIRNPLFDSTLWDDFDFRDDDIIIGSWSKSGTTWVQQIVGQLIFDGDENIRIAEISPWYDFALTSHQTVKNAVKAQAHRRFLKTHLPLEALTFSPKAKYLYVARDGRDVAWSMHHHHSNLTTAFYEEYNRTALNGPARAAPMGPPTADITSYFRDWLAYDGYPFPSFWGHVRGWWEARHLPNVTLVHFAELKQNMPEQIRRIARFLDLSIDDHRWGAIVEHCTFEFMKRHADHAAPFGGAIWEGGGRTFIHKGTDGRWRDLLTPSDIRAYEERARQELGEDCAHWLATGELRTPA